MAIVSLPPLTPEKRRRQVSALAGVLARQVLLAWQAELALTVEEQPPSTG